jgi:hypothetical protein
LNCELKELSLIRDCQKSFKSGHTKTPAFLLLIEHVIPGLNNNKAALALFLEIQKTFVEVYVGSFQNLLRQDFLLSCYINTFIIGPPQLLMEILSPGVSGSKICKSLIR